MPPPIHDAELLAGVLLRLVCLQKPEDGAPLGGGHSLRCGDLAAAANLLAGCAHDTTALYTRVPRFMGALAAATSPFFMHSYTRYLLATLEAIHTPGACVRCSLGATKGLFSRPSVISTRTPQPVCDSHAPLAAAPACALLVRR